MPICVPGNPAKQRRAATRLEYTKVTGRREEQKKQGKLLFDCTRNCTNLAKMTRSWQDVVAEKRQTRTQKLNAHEGPESSVEGQAQHTDSIPIVDFETEQLTSLIASGCITAKSVTKAFIKRYCLHSDTQALDWRTSVAKLTLIGLLQSNCSS
jgi:hypothetical protein